MRQKSYIQQLRKQRGITQQELANKAKISKSYLAGIEQGRHTPTVAVLARIAKVLDVSINDLKGGI